MDIQIIKKHKKTVFSLIFLAIISYIGVYSRLSTLSTPTVLDYDPWWFYRYAAMIEANNFVPPKWDIQSYYPPGRKFTVLDGWPYTIIFLHLFLKFFIPTITLMKAAILSPLFMVAIIPIPAYLLGRRLSNDLGGLSTALFAVLAPSFIGVSMAGYSDTDAPITFYLFLTLFSTLVAMKERKPIFILFSIITNLLFMWNWGAGWLTLILFTMFFVGLPIFRIFEEFIHTFSISFDKHLFFKEIKDIGYPLISIITITNLLGFVLFGFTEFDSFFGGISFTGLGVIVRSIIFLLILVWLGLLFFTYYEDARKKDRKAIFVLCSLPILAVLAIFSVLRVPTSPLLVNISVAELQPLNVLSLNGFLSVANRVGLITITLSFGLIPLILYKIWIKEKISKEEIFFFLFVFSMFFLITRGIRFSLQFTVAAAASAGYLIAHYKKYPRIIFLILLVSLIMLIMVFPRTLPNMLGMSFILLLSFFVFISKNEKTMNKMTLAIFLFQVFFFISSSIQIGFSSRGMLISKNWYDMLDWFVNNADKDSLLMTWWDPGHILAGYTYYKKKPLKVHADGAHCPPKDCIPYNHNIRIQDMGRIFSTNDEEEAIKIIEKYRNLTQEQCQKVYEKFDGYVPPDACKPVSEIYLIASNDLIGKYYWMSYFGTGIGQNFIQLQLSRIDQSGSLIYGDGIISVLQQNNTLYGVLNLPTQGIRNAIIKEVIYYSNTNRIINTYNSSNTIDGTLWIDPSFRYVIYMTPQLRNSLFTKMFFFMGEGLKHFELVYYNPEIRVFKVIF